MLGRLVGSHAEVNALIEGVRACGAQVLKEPQDGPLGRYHAIFADPVGLRWEVAFHLDWRPHPGVPVRVDDL